MKLSKSKTDVDCQMNQSLIGVLIGAPGSGKGTQGRILADSLGIPLISTGDLLRREVAGGSALGREVRKVLEAGGLVSDELVNNMVSSRIADPDCERRGFILDGYPRSVGQAKYLDARLGYAPLVIHLQVPLEELTNRLAGRRLCPVCSSTFHISGVPNGKCPKDSAVLTTRRDDTQDAVKTRLTTYTKYEKALVRYYKSGNYRAIDGAGSLDTISSRMAAAVGLFCPAAA